MRKMNCETVQDRLPELATDRLEAEDRRVLAAHVEECAECREILGTLRLLAASRPSLPVGLASRIQEAARQEIRGSVAEARMATGTASGLGSGRRWRFSTPAWGLAAAAVVALVMGRTLLPGGEPEPQLLALGDAEFPALLTDDVMVAGGPVLDGLSDDDLALLLEELEP